ncbi:MAG: MarR family winged helix-turn-helix transcriptional regulator [Rhodospirillales bacterium]
MKKQTKRSGQPAGPAAPPRPEAPREDPPLFVLLNEIGIIEQLMRNRFEAARPAGLRLAHFILLNHLARTGDGKNPVSIARALQLAKGAITNTLHRLEERGLVSVLPDPADARGKRVWLTQEGRDARDAVVVEIGKSFADVAQAMPPARCQAVLPDLQHLRRHLDRFRKPGGPQET